MIILKSKNKGHPSIHGIKLCLSKVCFLFAQLILPHHMQIFAFNLCAPPMIRSLQRPTIRSIVQCATFVKDYLPYLWNLIAYNVSPSVVTA